MTSDLSDAEWQALHQHFLDGDPIAFAEICSHALEELITYLKKHFPIDDPQIDPNIHGVVAIDTLLDYQESPQKFNPDKMNLYAFLRMAAHRDMQNALGKEITRQKKISSLDDERVEDAVSFRNSIQEDEIGDDDEWLSKYTNLSREQIIKGLEEQLSPVELRIVLMMFEGIRETQKYAEVLGVSDLDIEAQRAEVKRTKDRLQKKIERFGNRIKGGS